MNILLINPPHPSIGSRMPNEHLPPLGLLSIGGPLLDAGHTVHLLDADFDNLPYAEIVSRTLDIDPEIVLLGHSGSTSAQPIIENISRRLKLVRPNLMVIVGGVYPTYHPEQILDGVPEINVVVRGEGEQVILDLVAAIEHQTDLDWVKGIAFRKDGATVTTLPAKLIRLDDYRVGWELMGDTPYTYWGRRKAVVIQFSRGCPYPCSYCGQSLFWRKWRSRDPQGLADEIEMLHKKYGIEVINFADENPSTHPERWKAFLEALIAKNLDLTLVGSIRADNIVRDAEHLHLYKQAGFERFLLGIENYDEEVLRRVKKAGTTSKDREAIRLLRKHDILSMATYVIGIGEERIMDFVNSLRQLLVYDPDQIQLLYMTPHHWTPYFREIEDREVIQRDPSKWDYKHQVLKSKHVKPWQMILYVKLIEVIMQARPKALYRWLFHRDRKLRKAMSWYNHIGKRVWFYEWFQFLFRTQFATETVSLRSYWSSRQWRSHEAPANPLPLEPANTETPLPDHPAQLEA